MLLSSLLSFLVLFLIPLVVGIGFAGLIKRAVNIEESFVLGQFVLYAAFQIIAVPLILAKASFSSLCWVFCIVVFSLIAVMVVLRCFHKVKIFPVLEIGEDIVLFIIMLCVFLYVLYKSITMQHLDDDDARFVVNAIDMIQSDTVFLTDPGVGYAIPVWTGELSRDVVSPWAAYQALLAKTTLTHPTVMIHTIQPIFLYTSVFAVHWLLSKYLVGEKTSDRCLFVIVLWFLILFGCETVYSSETFLIYRLWQGKAVVTGIGIPFLMSLLLHEYKNHSIGSVFSIVIVSFAMSLFSNMGIVLCAALIGCFGLVYGIIKHNVLTSFSIWITAIPSIIYGLIAKLM